MPPYGRAIWKERLGRAIVCGCVVLGFLAVGRWPVSGQTPQWIWGGDPNGAAGAGHTVYLRKTFRTPPLTWNARLTVSADDEAEVFLNSVLVATCRRWNEP